MSERFQKYALTALDHACTTIANAPDTNRNNTLNTEAFGIGQLVGSGLLTRFEAERQLLAAALASGLERPSAEATIESGLTAGISKPRKLTEEPLRRSHPGEALMIPGVHKGVREAALYAAEIYAKSKPIENTPAEHYLRDVRGLKGDLPASFRFSPHLWHSALHRNLPALVVPVTRADAPNAKITSIHRTYLDPITSRKIAGDATKKMLGPAKGGAIWLGLYAAHMLIAEGIEKTLACAHASGIPACVGMSSTLLPSVTWPRGVTKVTICADPNQAGEMAVNRAGALWTEQNIEVLVAYPPVVGKDWDECRPDAVAAAIKNARPWAKVGRQRTTEERERILQRLNPSKDIEFDRDESGKLVVNEFNALLSMTSLGYKFSYDEFSQQYYATGVKDVDNMLTDASVDEIYLSIQREHFLRFRYEDLRRIIHAEARRHKFHPIREYLDGLKWDGQERISEWLAAYGGAEDTPFVRAVSRIMLVAAVRRIREPGCKFDEMVVLESPEGCYKSSALQVLAGPGAFSDEAPINSGPREVIERLRGNWIVECADLAGMRKADVEHLKAFLSRPCDIATMKFQRETTRFPRCCIFVGTTNDSNYLRSETGSRRFWPVKVVNFNVAKLAQHRDQLWAEAAAAEASGESIRLPEEFWPFATAEQERREEVDEWDGIIHAWLNNELASLRNPLIPYRTSLIEAAQGALHVKAEAFDSRVQKRVARALRRAGWQRTPKTNGKHYWIKPPDAFEL